MSGIINRGTMSLSNAIARFDNERYEGCTGCPHVWDNEKGEWIRDFADDVTAFNENDGFGPGEVSLLCDQCAEEDKLSCDFCGHTADDDNGVTGHKALDESMFYNYCDVCWSKHRQEFTQDMGYDEDDCDWRDDEDDTIYEDGDDVDYTSDEPFSCDDGPEPDRE